MAATRLHVATCEGGSQTVEQQITATYTHPFGFGCIEEIAMLALVVTTTSGFTVSDSAILG